jgi:hypothetical protein
MMLHGSQRRNAHVAVAALAAALTALAAVLSCTGPQLTCDDLGTCAPLDASTMDAIDERAFRSDARTDVAIDSIACDPTKDPKDDPCVLNNAAGVFVASPGDGGAPLASADGSMSRPYATIEQALSQLGNKTRIYVCNGSYNEQVHISTAVRVYGGLSCSSTGNGLVWSYVGGRAQVTSSPSAYALWVTDVASDSGAAVAVEDMSFAAPSATAPGSSSIAALISSSSVDLLRVTLSAGNGANGAAGADGTTDPNYLGLAPAGGSQVWSPGPLGPTPISGGAGGINRCLHDGASAGGDGGLGCDRSDPGLGTPGTASPPAPATAAGRDGLPAATVVVTDAGGTVIVSGNDPGADGLPGAGGAAPAMVYGALSPSGWLPTPGGDGSPGNPGQGGAGATDPLYGTCVPSETDVGGGGGGAGGCGGAFGKGGGGGGASVALASVGSTVGLQRCTLAAAAGGAGGPGGAGQDGQAGGAGGDDTSLSSGHASGAAGGNGAGGSGGAGGTGGISVGILYLGSTIASDTATLQSTTPGSPGAAGTGGRGGAHATAGVLATGMDGNPGSMGTAGASASFLKLM